MASVPRRFRRRLLAVMLAAGLLPLLALGWMGRAAVESALSLSPRRIEGVLERAEARVGDPALRDELRQAQLSLAQAELARMTLSRRAPAALLLAAIVAAALMAGAAWLLGRALARPVEALAADMARIGRGEELPDAPGDDRDEMQFLGTRLRAMARELVEGRRRLRISEGLAAWREVARALAHELRNPLTAMQMAVARLARPPDPRLAEPLALLEEELALLGRLTQSFATFAKLPEPVRLPLDGAALVAEVCALYGGAGPVAVQCAVSAPLPLAADADQLRRALGNLIKNALEASRAGDGPVRVEAAREAGAVRITVSDAGSGIGRPLGAAELTRSLGSAKAGGSGLGLPIANKIVHEHGGSLRLEPLPGRGTRAVMELPS